RGLAALRDRASGVVDGRRAHEECGHRRRWLGAVVYRGRASVRAPAARPEGRLAADRGARDRVEHAADFLSRFPWRGDRRGRGPLYGAAPALGSARVAAVLRVLSTTGCADRGP